MATSQASRGPETRQYAEQLQLHERKFIGGQLCPRLPSPGPPSRHSLQMSSALRRLSSQVPRLTRGLKTSGPTKKGTEKYSHEEIVYGDGHHGVRPGYHYVSPALHFRKLTASPSLQA